MHVKRIIWMGVRTAAFDEMRTLLGGTMGIPITHDAAGVVWFGMDDGEIQIYDDSDADHEFFGVGPTVGFEVDDFHGARAEMVTAGVEFIGDPQTDGSMWWNHFKGPDNNIYEILGPA